MDSVNLDDTNIEEELQVEEETPTTEEPIQEETVENFSDELDTLETEEDILKHASSLKPEEIQELEEEATEEEPTLDTKDEPEADYSFDLKDGDIELTLDLTTEEGRKQGRMLMMQGLNYAGKTTELAKHRSFVQYAEENGISLEDMQQLIDAKAGSKEAVANIAKKSNVDVFDLDNDMAENYKQEPIQMPEVVDPRLDTMANEILSNDSYRDSFQKWFPTMPEDIQQAVTGNPDVLRGVQEDLQSGIFEPAMEQAYKYQRINGMDFSNAYTKAKHEINTMNADTPQKPISRGDRQRASSSRSNSAGTTSNRGGYNAGVISDMADDDFLNNYQSIISSVRQNR